MTRVNWLRTVYLVSAALPDMLARSDGHIVIVSSGAGHRSFPGAAVYGATKGAQRMFGEALRHELAGTGVSLTMVYPGEIATSLHDHEKETMPDWYRGGPDAVAPERLAEKVIEGVERDARSVYYPRLVRLLGAVHGLSPRASDAMLRALRGRSAAPRRG
jgi:short-subunit dehydrogenase